MPRLVKGAKWTYGWVVVGPKGELTIPPEAWEEYGFQPGGEAIIAPGSRTSGGLAITTPALVAERKAASDIAIRTLGRGRFGARRVILPREVSMEAGERLLAVRGSRFGLGLVSKGPIYDEALKHPELETFGITEELR